MSLEEAPSTSHVVLTELATKLYVHLGALNLGVDLGISARLDPLELLEDREGCAWQALNGGRPMLPDLGSCSLPTFPSGAIPCIPKHLA